jgi:hypothetical protein
MIVSSSAQQRYYAQANSDFEKTILNIRNQERAAV